MDKIRSTFNEYFQPWEIKLPNPCPEKGEIKKEGWFINYALIDGGLEFWAGHRMTNSRYVRIENDGKYADMEAQGWYEKEFYSIGDTEEQTRANERAMQTHNRRFYDHMKERGLWPDLGELE